MPWLVTAVARAVLGAVLCAVVVAVGVAQVVLRGGWSVALAVVVAHIIIGVVVAQHHVVMGADESRATVECRLGVLGVVLGGSVAGLEASVPPPSTVH